MTAAVGAAPVPPTSPATPDEVVGSDSSPLTPGEFAALMAPLGPFERRPRLAVATSGGPDSLALCLLADGWARARGGDVTGLTVDHGLRPESGAEAATVGRWLAARGIAHTVLPWRGPKPTAGVQAAARAARYGLLGDWCRAHGVLHLLLAHHRDDQAETLLLRRERRSGPDGLAGMAAVREVEGLRLLRPLLPVPKDRLRATLLAAFGQPWIEDPSNRNPAFTRARLRRRPGGDNAALAEAARRYGLRRTDVDKEVAEALARWARPHPAGFVELDRRGLAAAEPEIVRRVFERCLGAVAGGRVYPPRGARLAGLLGALRGEAAPFAGRTLHGCRVLPRRGGDRLLICREPAAVGGAVVLNPGEAALWDGRFRVRYVAGEGPLTVRALGEADRRLWPDAPAAAAALPAPVRPSLPSLWQLDRLLAVPHFESSGSGTFALQVQLMFYSLVPLAGAPFAGNGVASGGS